MAQRRGKLQLGAPKAGSPRCGGRVVSGPQRTAVRAYLVSNTTAGRDRAAMRRDGLVLRALRHPPSNVSWLHEHVEQDMGEHRRTQTLVHPTSNGPREY